MALAWMTYVAIVSAAAGLAAVAAERALRLYGRPARWAWAGALFASAALPAAAWALPRLPGGGAPEAAGALALPAIVVGGPAAVGSAAAAGAPGWLAALDAALLVLWPLSALAVAGAAARSALRLRRERAAWGAGTVDGQPVLLAADRGPAVVGLLRGEVVVPRWVAELEAEVRRAVLLHEREHLRAGDHRLFAAGAAALLLAPWNPLLWWQLRRLRLAVECDCDARVLARGVPRNTYGASLLGVGARLSGLPWGVAAFAEPRTFLERRVETMTRKRPRWRGPRALAAAAAAAGLLFVACETSPPAGEDHQHRVELVDRDAAAEAPGAAASERPEFILYDTPPRLRNGTEVMRALQEAYPAALREAGVGGRVALWIHLDETGKVTSSQVKESSGEPALDAAALRVVESMSFQPARNDGEPTRVWVSQNITFEVPPDMQGAMDLTGPPDERPLVVVDGEVRSERGIPSGLDPADIHRIEVLKGEAARALYGERAPAGVVRITTKAAAGAAGERG